MIFDGVRFPSINQALSALPPLAGIDEIRPRLKQFADLLRTRESMPKITKTIIASAKPGYTWDDMLPGFGLRVYPKTGRKAYVIRFRTATGTERMLHVGSPAELHPEQAREAARVIRAEARAGRDPKLERTNARNAPRLEELRDRFMSDHASQKKPGTRRNYEILWRKHLLPILGNPAVRDLTEADAVKVRNRMSETPTNANRALEVLSKACDLAERWKWRPINSNPCKHVDAYDENAIERILEPDEIARVWSALDHDDVMPNARTLFRLLLLTGLRVSEWRLSKWSWVDLDNAALNLPDSKNGKRRVSLAPEVVEMLRELPRASVYVLPGRTGGPIGGHRKMWLKALKRAGITDRVRIHDARHTTGSYAHRAGASQREVADLLGHKQIATAARYIHGPGSEKHKNAERAAGAVLSIIKNNRARPKVA